MPERQKVIPAHAGIKEQEPHFPRRRFLGPPAQSAAVDGQRSRAALSSAASTFGGDIGRSVMRKPVAL